MARVRLLRSRKMIRAQRGVLRISLAKERLSRTSHTSQVRSLPARLGTCICGCHVRQPPAPGTGLRHARCVLAEYVPHLHTLLQHEQGVDLSVLYKCLDSANKLYGYLIQ